MEDTLTRTRPNELQAPFAYTVRDYSRMSGLGHTTIWKAIREKRIKVYRPPGVRRTLIEGASGREFLAVEPADHDDTSGQAQPDKPIGNARGGTVSNARAGAVGAGRAGGPRGLDKGTKLPTSNVSNEIPRRGG
jgi:hypothetical protein